MPDKFLTLKELSVLLRISPSTARNRLYLGLSMPPSIRIGRARLFDRDEVEKWLATAKNLEARREGSYADAASPIKEIGMN